MHKHAALRAGLQRNILLSSYRNTTQLDVTATHGAKGRAMRCSTTRVAAHRRLEAHLTLTSRVVGWEWVKLEFTNLSNSGEDNECVLFSSCLVILWTRDFGGTVFRCCRPVSRANALRRRGACDPPHATRTDERTHKTNENQSADQHRPQDAPLPRFRMS